MTLWPILALSKAEAIHVGKKKKKTKKIIKKIILFFSPVGSKEGKKKTKK